MEQPFSKRHYIAGTKSIITGLLLTGSLLTGSLLTGCRNAIVPPAMPVLSTPKAFSKSQDTTSVADMSWRTFFQDANLVSLIDTALAKNPDIQLAIQRITVARANVENAKGLLAPQVNAVVSAGVDRYGKYTLNGVGNYDTNFSDRISGPRVIPNPTPDYFLGLRSSWELDIWGKLQNQRKSAQLRLLATEKSKHLITTALVAEIARLYYELLANDSELDIIQENIQLQERAVELVNVQKDAGRVTELAVQQFSAQLLNTRALEFQVEQDIIRIENQLNLLLGRYPQPIPRGKQLIQDQRLPSQISAGIASQMLSRRPDIKQAELEMEAANIDIAVAQAQFLPSLTLSPYVGFNAFRASVLFNPASLAAGILGGLAAPVFNRRLLKSNLLISEAQSKAAFYGYQKVVLTGFSEVSTSLKGLENYRKVASLQSQEVNVLKQSVGVSNELFRGGYAAYLEVITAQRNVLEAQLSLINTKRNQFTSLIDLYRSLGGGWN